MPLDNRAFGPSRGQDDFRASAVHKATKHADLKLLTYLIIDNNAITQFLDRDGARPIVYAIRFDNPSAVKFLIGLRNEDGTRKVDLLQTVAKTGNTLMHEAAWYGRTECAQVLLDTGCFTAADLGKVNGKGQTAMHVAAFRATESFIQLLVEHGASVEQKTCDPRQITRDPIQIAISMGKEANAKFMQDLTVAVAAIRFATRMMKKRANAKRSPKLMVTPVAHATSHDDAVFCIRFDFELQLFTADLEKSFLVQLAKHAGVEPSEVHVLSRIAGSVVLEIELRGANAAAGMATLGGSSVEELSAVLGYVVLDCSVKRKAADDDGTFGTASLQPTRARSTPGFDALAAVNASPPPRARAAA